MEVCLVPSLHPSLLTFAKLRRVCVFLWYGPWCNLMTIPMEMASKTTLTLEFVHPHQEHQISQTTKFRLVSSLDLIYSNSTVLQESNYI